ncbi:MAG: SDR family NAD(P)-dependent oxidoreductase [Hyphomonadaceae bacterium]
MTDPNARIILVTGASRGIGRAVARACASEGCQVIALGRAQRALEQLDDEIRADGKGACTIVPLDIKDGAAIDQLGAVLYERHGRLDGLAACAGVLGALTPVSNATPRVMEEVIAVNLIANHRLIRSLHPLLRASEAGRAVFLSSGAAKSARAYWGPYAASKAGLDALVLSYAAECAITPIKVNLLDPGPTRTAMRAKAYPGEDPQTQAPPEAVARHIAAMLRADHAGNRERWRYNKETDVLEGA